MGSKVRRRAFSPATLPSFLREAWGPSVGCGGRTGVSEMAMIMVMVMVVVMVVVVVMVIVRETAMVDDVRVG